MSRHPEQLVWDALRRAAGGVLFQRHEDKYSAGVPDLSGVLAGQQFWCELKAAPRAGRLLLRQRQLVWMAARATHGVPCILLTRRSPREWAGCRVTHSIFTALSAGANFDQVAVYGDSDAAPMPLLERLVEQP